MDTINEISEEIVINKILFIRGKKVMLDRDLQAQQRLHLHPCQRRSRKFDIAKCDIMLKNQNKKLEVANCDFKLWWNTKVALRIYRTRRRNAFKCIK